MSDANFEGWAILELMGHRRLAGYLLEEEIAGAAFVRIDVPGEIVTKPSGAQIEQAGATQFYAPAAVYCITPTSEKTARMIASRSRPAPVQRWELEPVPVPVPDIEPDEIEEDAGRPWFGAPPNA